MICRGFLITAIALSYTSLLQIHNLFCLERKPEGVAVSSGPARHNVAGDVCPPLRGGGAEDNLAGVPHGLLLCKAGSHPYKVHSAGLCDHRMDLTK